MFLKKTGSRQDYEQEYRFLRDGEHTVEGKPNVSVSRISETPRHHPAADNE
jgi:hypothetical protein